MNRECEELGGMDVLGSGVPAAAPPGLLVPSTSCTTIWCGVVPCRLVSNRVVSCRLALSCRGFQLLAFSRSPLGFGVVSHASRCLRPCVGDHASVVVGKSGGA